MKKYGMGDICYIIGDGQVRRGRISAKKGDSYFVQFVGACGALQVEQDEIYESKEAAQAILNGEKNRPQVGYLSTTPD